ncbi:MAG: hypothetical protein ACM3O7_00555 [Acidobacteriota bacterium]
MTGATEDEPPPFEGCPAPRPSLVVVVRLRGLEAGEAVSLVGAASYDLKNLACGVEPSPCEWGSDTTDPSVHPCRPEYSRPVKGTAKASAIATADAHGKASATLRFVVPESQVPCPAGASRPWYVQSGEWKARVTDRAHGLRLVGPPHFVIGP